MSLHGSGIYATWRIERDVERLDESEAPNRDGKLPIFHVPEPDLTGIYMMKSRRDGMNANAGIRAFSHCDIYKSVEH
jgi:hypothetical protein